jgi:hypothetical protein
VTLTKYGSATIGLGHTGSRKTSRGVLVEFEMATVTTTAPTGFASVSRAVVAAAADLAVAVERRLIGDDRVTTARGNALAAIEADRRRSQARHEMTELVSALASRR